VPSHPAPQEYPKAQEKAGTDRKDDGDKEIDKEGEESPRDKGDHHHNQQGHV